MRVKAERRRETGLPSGGAEPERDGLARLRAGGYPRQEAVHVSYPRAVGTGGRKPKLGAHVKQQILGVVAAMVVLTAAMPAGAQPMPPPLPPYAPATGNAPVQIVIPAVLPTILGFTSPTGGDASLVLRATTLITNAWFDASAPYHPTAVGVYSRLGRRPASESLDNSNINVAVTTASYRVLNSIYPLQQVEWRDMMIDAGLDPDEDSEDLRAWSTIILAECEDSI